MKRIFIGGLGRSGTTITLSALYHHHEVLAFPVETKFLVEEDGFAAVIDALTCNFSVAWAMAAVDRFETLMRRQVTGLDDSKFKHQEVLPIIKFTNYEEALNEFTQLIRARSYFDDPAPLLAATRKFVDQTFDDAARRENYGAWVEKTPSNIWRIDLLRTLWPDCYIVHCIRDPRDIMLSLLERRWLPTNIVQALTIFESHLAALIKVRRIHMNNPKWLELRLEDLVEHTEPTLAKLAEFVGLAPYHNEKVASVSGLMNAYYEKKGPSSIHLTPENRDLIVSWLRPAVVELGYPATWGAVSEP
ncbi:sulfotransferase family protein [Rhizobium terrae]|uniref:sulfotransferase family protein n=1 Tax=Rhizobium terrae TaxID=2171756 RepID=UPI000E3E68C6|nr:sulfotransferase [Rhizobium terrae]